MVYKPHKIIRNIVNALEFLTACYLFFSTQSLAANSSDIGTLYKSTENHVGFSTASGLFEIPVSYLMSSPSLDTINKDITANGFDIAFWMPDGRPTEKWINSFPDYHASESNRPDPGSDEWVVSVVLQSNGYKIDDKEKNVRRTLNLMRLIGNGEFKVDKSRHIISLYYRKYNKYKNIYESSYHYGDGDGYNVLMDCSYGETPNKLCLGFIVLTDLGLQGNIRIPEPIINNLEQVISLVRSKLISWKR